MAASHSFKHLKTRTVMDKVWSSCLWNWFWIMFGLRTRTLFLRGLLTKKVRVGKTMHTRLPKTLLVAGHGEEKVKIIGTRKSSDKPKKKTHKIPKWIEICNFSADTILSSHPVDDVYLEKYARWNLGVGTMNWQVSFAKQTIYLGTVWLVRRGFMNHATMGFMITGLIFLLCNLRGNISAWYNLLELFWVWLYGLNVCKTSCK